MAGVRTKFRPVVASVGSTRVNTEYMSVTQFAQAVKSQMDAIVKNFELWAAHMREQGPEILHDALKPTFDESQEIVPYDTGALKNSGYLEMRQTRSQTQVEIGYGRGGTPFYAPVVHERLDMRHLEPTQAKFLQQPLEKNLDQIRQDILAGYKEVSGA